MFLFGLSSVIFKVSVAGFEHVFICWERYFRIRITIAIVLIVKYLTQKTNTYSKSATETPQKMWDLLKINSRDCVSLLSTFDISKTWFKCFFWWTINMHLFTVMVLFLQCLSDVFIVKFKQILRFDLLFLLSALNMY